MPLIITLNMNIKIKFLPQYYLDYDPSNDRCMLLIKGISGDLDHWVLGDSIIKTLYIIFDADNHKIGIMTNELNFGRHHQDIVYVHIPNEINKIVILIIVTIVTFTMMAIVLCYKCYMR